jgi:hypothetical protein
MKKPKFEIEYVKSEQEYRIKAIMPNGKILYYETETGFRLFSFKKEAKEEIKRFKYFYPVYGFEDPNVGYIEVKEKTSDPCALGMLLTKSGGAYKYPEKYLEK